MEEKLNASFREIARTAQVRGFRRGKAPTKVVRRMYGKRVRGEVTQNLVENALVHAVQEHSLSLVTSPHVQPPDIEDGKPLTFTAKLEVHPDVASVNLDDVFDSGARRAR